MQRHAGQCFAYEERQGYIELVKSFKKKKKKGQLEQGNSEEQTGVCR